MSLSRRFVLGLPLAAAFAARAGAQTAGNAAPAAIERFYDALLAVMKQAKRRTFDQRYAQLAPAVSATLNLPLMARIAVGPGWSGFTPQQQQRVTDAFSRYTISVYANRFDGYGGERFVVTPTPTPNPNGLIVDTQIVKANGEPVSLKYLMRQDATGAWRVIDVYLSGSISELATRRSEFSAVLQRAGADGLVQLLEQRTAALRTG